LTALSQLAAAPFLLVGGHHLAGRSLTTDRWTIKCEKNINHSFTLLNHERRFGHFSVEYRCFDSISGVFCHDGNGN
jgi:hypothetical protein